MSKKIMELIPKELHKDLIDEVKEIMAEEERIAALQAVEKSKTEVSPLMKEYLETNKKK